MTPAQQVAKWRKAKRLPAFVTRAIRVAESYFADKGTAPAQSAKVRAIQTALDEGNWGCQREAVYALVSALTGHRYAPPLCESVSHWLPSDLPPYGLFLLDDGRIVLSGYPSTDEDDPACECVQGDGFNTYLGKIERAATEEESRDFINDLPSAILFRWSQGLLWAEDFEADED